MKNAVGCGSRRNFLESIGGGFAGLALAQMLHAESPVSSKASESTSGLRFPAKVRRVVQLFMTGGASPMDLFDYKPMLEKLDGQMLGPKEKPEGFTSPAGAIMKSPFRFRRHGECGRWVSELFPEQAKCVDDMAFLMAMASKTNVHGPATYMMNTGFLLPGFPCLGAWLSYGLGSINENLPTFVVLPDSRGLPYNQRGPFSAGFLPSVHQGTVIDIAAKPVVRDLEPTRDYEFTQHQADRESFEALQTLNRMQATDRLEDAIYESRIASYELAARLQLSAPEAFDLSGITEHRQREYGIGQPDTDDFGKRCLLAARLIERGVRFVQVWSGPQGATNNWDNHGNILTELPPMARSVDRPIAALLRDLKSQGLLEDTLILWTTEFGRTPFAQGSLGRDHNGGSFVTWMAGAGVKPGVAYGASDDWGYQAVEGKSYCYDLHATILHLMGIDHTRLTFRQNGIDRRLPDVHGRVIHEVLV